MPAPNIKQIVQSKVNELLLLKDRKLPVEVGVKVTNSILNNFRKGSFYGQPWEQPLRSKIGFDGPNHGPLTSGSNHLMLSSDYMPLPGRVIIQNRLVYAPVHNYGAEITVTQKMKGYFWSRYINAGGYNHGNMSKEAEFWRNMAIKKVGSTIKIPQRQFMGDHPKVDKLVEDIIIKNLTKVATDGINTRRSP